MIGHSSYSDGQTSLLGVRWVAAVTVIVGDDGSHSKASRIHEPENMMKGIHFDDDDDDDDDDANDDYV